MPSLSTPSAATLSHVATTNDHALPKPLLRGRFHAAAAVAALALTIALGVRSRADPPRLISMLIFGLSMVELYSVSAIYHIGRWGPVVWRRLRALDHANIFILIAGTYTPLCFNVLSGWLRPALLAVIWALALAGAALATLTMRTPRWLSTALYVGMGWVSLLALPAFARELGWGAVALLLLGGGFYTAGAVVYARRRPDPFPRVLGFHEVFHLFVIAGGVAFAAAVWLWALPFPRV